jgi:hypothetical protein
MKKKMRSSFSSTAAPQWIWGCSRTLRECSKEQKEEQGNIAAVPLFLDYAAVDLRG